MTPRRALLLGATGLVGQQTLNALLHSQAIGSVTALVRSSEALAHWANHAKLHIIEAPLEECEQALADVKVDDIFCCLGTTMAQAITKQQFRLVDYDFPVRIARALHAKGAEHFLLVSAIGANAHSSVFYNRVKGDVEQTISEVGFKRVSIMQPSFLLGPRAQKRLGERIGIMLSQLLSFFLIFGLRRYRPIDAEHIAQAMVTLAVTQEVEPASFTQDAYPNSAIYWFDAILNLAYHYQSQHP